MEYVVRFSFIPGTTENTKAKFHLNPSYKEDTIYERSGHHTTKRHYLEIAELQERRSNRRVINIFPASSLTEKGRLLDFSTPQGKYILKIKEMENCEDLLKTAQLLEKKCTALKENKKYINFYHPRNKTILIAAKQLNIELPKGKIPRDQLDSILNMAEAIQNIKNKSTQLEQDSITLMDQIDRKEQREKIKN